MLAFCALLDVWECVDFLVFATGHLLTSSWQIISPLLKPSRLLLTGCTEHISVFGIILPSLEALIIKQYVAAIQQIALIFLLRLSVSSIAQRLGDKIINFNVIWQCWLCTFLNEDIMDGNIACSIFSYKHIQSFNWYPDFIFGNLQNAIWCNAVANECEQIWAN